MELIVISMTSHLAAGKAIEEYGNNRNAML